MPKTMEFKEEDGTQYKISFSEKLQMNVLQELRRNTLWKKKGFYAKMALFALLLLIFLTFLYIMYRLDTVDFFTTILYR